MSMTVYFAKLNLISDDIFKLYDYPKERRNISFALYDAIKSNQVWEKESLYIDDKGEQHNTVIEYSAHILKVDDALTYIEGWIYKKSTLYYKVLDETTNTLIQRSTENTEGNRFTIDVDHGFVGYYTSARFGYKEFLEAFVSLVNLGEESLEYNYRYSISLCTSGIDLDNIKNELKRIGHIKELRIRMQPPNPSDDLLDEIQERCDGLLKDLKDANVTEVEHYYSTKGTAGIDLNASLVSNTIDDIQGLHSGLTVEESTKKGYVSVDATSTAGRKYSSGEAKPIKHIIDSVEDFFDACIEVFRHL